MIAYIKTHDGAFKCVIDGETKNFDMSHPNYSTLVDSIKSQDIEAFFSSYEIAKPYITWANDFVVRDGIMTYNGIKIPDDLYSKIDEMIAEGFDPTPIYNFIKRLAENPSYQVLHNLFKFISYVGIPIRDDGHIIAYKAVNKTEEGFVDIYTGKIKQKVGDTISMPRNLVSDRSSDGCSDGLHVGVMEYAKHYGGATAAILICSVDPADVVSVPDDHSCQKMRCCKYTILKIDDNLQKQGDYV